MVKSAGSLAGLALTVGLLGITLGVTSGVVKGTQRQLGQRQMKPKKSRLKRAGIF